MFRIYADEWLDDIGINVYFKMMGAREASLDKEHGVKWPKRNLFFTSLFITRLHSGTEGASAGVYHFNNVAKWTKKLHTDIFQYDKLFFPAHLSLHWFLIVVDNKERMIVCYDPMHGSHHEYMEVVRRYLCDEYARLNKRQIIWGYKKKDRDRGASFPGQADTSSCGVYTCLYANRISLGYGLETIQSIHGASLYRMYMHSLFFPFLGH
jgi:Ulp1 family protease